MSIASSCSFQQVNPIAASPQLGSDPDPQVVQNRKENCTCARSTEFPLRIPIETGHRNGHSPPVPRARHGLPSGGGAGGVLLKRALRLRISVALRYSAIAGRHGVQEQRSTSDAVTDLGSEGRVKRPGPTVGSTAPGPRSLSRQCPSNRPDALGPRAFRPSTTPPHVHLRPASTRSVPHPTHTPQRREPLGRTLTRWRTTSSPRSHADA